MKTDGNCCICNKEVVSSAKGKTIPEIYDVNTWRKKGKRQ